MKRYIALFAASLVLAMVVPKAQAVVLFEDTFDSYADQTALQAVWTPTGCTLSGVGCSQVRGGSPPALSNELSQDFADTAHLQTLLNHSPVGSPNTSDASERNHHILSTPTPLLAVGDKLVYSFDYYDITGSGNPYREFADLRFFDGTVYGTNANQVISMGLNNNELAADSGGNFYMARVVGYSPVATDPDGGLDERVTGANQYFKLNDTAGAVLRSAGWHNLKVEISTSNGTSQDYSFYVDGTLSEKVSNIGTTLRQYNAISIGAGVSSTSDAYYDNIKLELITGAAGLAGDFNSDNKVDAADYAKWRKNEVANAALPNDNGLTTQADRFNLWRANFGKPPGAGSSLSSAAVPEPTTIGLVICGLAAIGLGRRSR